MKLPCLLLLSLCIALPVASVQAEGNTAAGTAPSAGKPPSKDRISRLLKKFDANGDGKLDQTELVAMVEFRMEHRDKSRAALSSQTSPKSLQVAPQASMNPSKRAERLLKKFDVNGDGALDRKELLVMMEAHKERQKQKASSSTGSKTAN